MIEFEGLTFNNEDEAINFLRVENARLKNRFARAEQEYRFRIREFKTSYEKQLFKLSEEKQNLYHTANFHKIKFAIKQIEKIKDLYKKHLDYEKIYDSFRVQMLDQDIEELINELNRNS